MIGLVMRLLYHPAITKNSYMQSRFHEDSSFKYLKLIFFFHSYILITFNYGQ